jgi:hypothetical protein
MMPRISLSRPGITGCGSPWWVNLARSMSLPGFSPVNVGEVVAQRDDEHKASGKRHRDQDQPPVLPGDLSESVHGWGQCNPITASLISKTSAQPSPICGFCPEKFIQLVRPMLAARYSALQQSGNGLQSIYLTEILPPMAEVLIGLIGDEAKLIAGQSVALNPEAIPQTQNADLEVWEHQIEATIESDSLIPDTDRAALIVARRGQGLFKQRVMQIENRCRVTGVNNPVHLVGSHCKPWRFKQ